MMKNTKYLIIKKFVKDTDIPIGTASAFTSLFKSESWCYSLWIVQFRY